MTHEVTATAAYTCERCDKPILPGRRVAWLADEDALVHPACAEDQDEETAA